MRLVFRTDASREIGTGHVVRCASLAETVRQIGDEILFCCRDLPGNMIAWLKERGFSVTVIGDAAAETRQAAEGADWLVVDHYNLDAAWEKQARGSAWLFALDDLGRAHDCDLLLDQNYKNPLHSKYAVPATCEKLLGPRFALIRPEFAAHRDRSLARPRHTISRLLVFMSGTDKQNETTKALQGIALSHYRGMTVDVVIGSGNPHRILVEAACNALPRAQLHIQTPHMAELMSGADLMLCAAGSISWERCTLGVPALVTILADNQVHIAESLARAETQRTLGWYNSLAPANYARALEALTVDELATMARAAAAICDGQGAARVAERLRILKG